MSNENSGGAMAQMPRYIGCKAVWALRIRSIEPMSGGQHRLTFHENFAPITTAEGWLERRGAQAGGYFIQYQDGYTSWCPAETFTKDYMPAEDWGVQFGQEPKYRINMAGRLANRQTGIAIPDEEPVITFRGKDMLLPSVLRFYASSLPAGEHRDDVERQLHKIEQFQAAFSTYVRIPD